jgi:formylglycine-generating enzyme required for sulfatase activity
MAGEALNVFISYSHQDEGLKDELVNYHLKLLQRDGKINTWQDRNIEAGAVWDEEIRNNLKKADIILMLVTRQFLASDYCYGKEMMRAIKRHEEGTARVISVILGPCSWQYTPFQKLQVLPQDGKPVTRWADQADAFLDIELGIRQVVDSLIAERQAAEAQQSHQGRQQQTAPQTTPTTLPATKTFKFEVVTLNNQGQEQTRTRQQAEYFTEDLGNGTWLDMVLIPGGSFMMGSPNSEGDASERPQHKVTVQPFCMGKFAVTQAQWRAVAAMPKVERDLEADPSFKGAMRPVEGVSWYGAVEFCKRLSRYANRQYRLPSEAEWEYACRAKMTTSYSFGNAISGDYVNFKDQKTVVISKGLLGIGRKEVKRGIFRKQTTEVGSFPANAFGLYDMHGNVWEWCQDVWHDSYEGAPLDGSVWVEGGDQGRRVLRGGTWGCYPGDCRSAVRVTLAPHDPAIFTHGFRVVCGDA